MSARLMVLSVTLALTFLPRLQAWELKERFVLKGTLWVNGLALSPNGKLVASSCGGTGEQQVKLWNAATRNEIALLPARTYFGKLAFSPDSKFLLGTDNDRRVTVWDIATAKEYRGFKGHEDSVLTQAFSQDGTKIVSAGDHEVKIWDVARGTQIGSFKRPVSSYAIAINNDYSLVAAPNFQEIDLWDARTGKLAAFLSEHRGQVGCLAFTPDGKTLVAASNWSTHDYWYHGQVKVWDVAKRREKATLKGDFHHVQALAISPDGKTLALIVEKKSHTDAELRLLDLATGLEFFRHSGKGRSFASLSFTPGGHPLIIGEARYRWTLWEAMPSKKHE